MGEYERLKEQRDAMMAKRCDELAMEIMELIINDRMISMTCAVDDAHGCVGLWSSVAQEQISAVIAKGKPSRC